MNNLEIAGSVLTRYAALERAAKGAGADATRAKSELEVADQSLQAAEVKLSEFRAASPEQRLALLKQFVNEAQAGRSFLALWVEDRETRRA